jgi:hypothetical protein
VEEVLYGSEGGLILVDRLEGLVDSVVRCLVGVAEHVGSSGDVLVEYVDRFGEVGGGRTCETGAVGVGVESFDTCWDGGGVFGDVGDGVCGGGGGTFLLANGVLDGVLGSVVVQVVRGVVGDGVFLIVRVVGGAFVVWRGTGVGEFTRGDASSSLESSLMSVHVSTRISSSDASCVACGSALARCLCASTRVGGLSGGRGCFSTTEARGGIGISGLVVYAVATKIPLEN